MPKKDYKMDMCSGPILKKMMIFAVPLMCSSVLQLLFNAADIIVVGRFAGDSSMAAVGSNTSFINLLINLFIGLSVGANVLAARFFATNKEDELSKTLHTSILIGAIGGVMLTAVGAFGSRTVLTLMKSPPEVIDLAEVYLRIFFMGMPATLIYNFGSAVLRAVGDTKRPLRYLFFAGVVNVILNLVFVIRFKMDVAGVAYATVISQYISAALIIRCLINESGGIRLDISRLRLDPQKLALILRIGLPAGFTGIVFSISNVVIQSSINLFGEIVVSGSSASANLEMFVYAAMNAFYQATLSFCGQNAGVGNYKRVRQVTITGMLCVLVAGTVLGGAMAFMGSLLLGIYTDNPDIVLQGLVRLRIICYPYALGGMMDVMCGALRGIGYSIMPMIVSLMGACVLRLLWLATVFQMPQFHTPFTIYVSYPITWSITLFVHLVCFIVLIRKLEKRSAAQAISAQP